MLDRTILMQALESAVSQIFCFSLFFRPELRRGAFMFLAARPPVEELFFYTELQESFTV